MAKQTPKHILSKDGVFELIRNDFFAGWKKVEIPKGEPGIAWLRAKIPFDLWDELIQWCELTQQTHKSEALAFLMYNEETDTWSIWYPPQVTNGMTVKSDSDCDEYKEQRKKYGDMLQMGTLHHHCTGSAFASGVDKNDEIDRDGLHFTIGKLDEDEYDIHFRLCAYGVCHDQDPTSVIEPPEWLKKAPLSEQNKQVILNKILGSKTDQSKFEKLRKIMETNIKKPQASSNGYKGQTSFGFGWNHAARKHKPSSTYWEDDEFDYETTMRPVSHERNNPESKATAIENLIDRAIHTFALENYLTNLSDQNKANKILETWENDRTPAEVERDWETVCYFDLRAFNNIIEENEALKHRATRHILKLAGFEFTGSFASKEEVNYALDLIKSAQEAFNNPEPVDL